jgi:hypothetical protein
MIVSIDDDILDGLKNQFEQVKQAWAQREQCGRRA